MLFRISSNKKQLHKVLHTSFIDSNIWERQHIEEWIRTNPEMLGEELLVISTEFDLFIGTKERLDILALDKSGRLVIIELKRDNHAGHADLQAIRYAAMISSFSMDKLVHHYQSYLEKINELNNKSEEELKQEILSFIEDEEFTELKNNPRIILVSQDFSKEITTTVLWLRQHNIDIACVKISPYKVDEDIFITTEKIIPQNEIDDYLIKIKDKEIAQEKESSIRLKTKFILLDNGLVKAGDRIALKAHLPPYVEYKDDDPKFHATITGSTGIGKGIKWDFDGKEYAISKLTYDLFKEFDPEKIGRGVNGNYHWVTSSGKTLWQIAEEFINKQD